jgi:hypothetical protein
MTPQEKRSMLKRSLLEEALASEASTHEQNAATPEVKQRTLGDVGREFTESFGDMMTRATAAVPFSGIVDKIGAASYAGQQEVGDLFRDEENQKTFDERYDAELARKKGEVAKAIERSPAMGTAGDVLGAAAGGSALPGFGAGVKGLIGVGSRIASAMGLSALDQGTSGEELFDTEKAAQGGRTAGLIQAGIEAIPVVGKAASAAAAKPLSQAIKWGAENAPSILTGVNKQNVQKYLARSDAINSARTVQEIRNEIVEAYDKLKNEFDNKVISQQNFKDEYKRLETRLAETFSDKKTKLLEAKRTAQNLLESAHARQVDGLREVAKRPPAEMRQEILEDLKTLRKGISQQSAKAFDIAEKSGKDVNVTQLNDWLTFNLNELRINGADPIGSIGQAFKVLSGYRDFLEQMPEKTMKLDAAKKLIQMIDADLDVSSMAGGYTPKAQRALGGFRQKLDGTLKEVPEYAEAMKPLADDTNLVSRAIDMGFGDESSLISLLNSVTSPKGELTMRMLEDLGKRTGKDYVGMISKFAEAKNTLQSRAALNALKEALPERRYLQKVENTMGRFSTPRIQSATDIILDTSPQRQAIHRLDGEISSVKGNLDKFAGWSPATTESRLETVMRGIPKDKKIYQTEGLERIGNLTGKDYLQELDDRGVADAFEKGFSHGSRNVNLWSWLGQWVGGKAAIAGGGAAGATIGAAIDTIGPKITKSGLDTYLKIQKGIQNGTLQKWSQSLMESGNRGQHALAATHFLLMQRDPSYRQTMEQMESEQP